MKVMAAYLIDKSMIHALSIVLKRCHDEVAEGRFWETFVDLRALFRQVIPFCLAVCGK